MSCLQYPFTAWQVTSNNLSEVPSFCSKATILSGWLGYLLGFNDELDYYIISVEVQVALINIKLELSETLMVTGQCPKAFFSSCFIFPVLCACDATPKSLTTTINSCLLATQGLTLQEQLPQ